MAKSGMARRSFYTRDVVIVPIVIAVVFLGVGVPIFLTADWRRPATWTGALIAWVPVIVMVARGALLRLQVEGDTLFVRNWLRTFRLRWDDIERFSIERTPYGGIQAAIHTNDEEGVYYVSGIGHRWLSSVEKAWQGEAGRIVEELNQLLQRRRGENVG